jgi:hypothetical protein
VNPTQFSGGSRVIQRGFLTLLYDYLADGVRPGGAGRSFRENGGGDEEAEGSRNEEAEGDSPSAWA